MEEGKGKCITRYSNYYCGKCFQVPEDLRRTFLGSHRYEILICNTDESRESPD
jgi:hypothetical protein